MDVRNHVQKEVTTKKDMRMMVSHTIYTFKWCTRIITNLNFKKIMGPKYDYRDFLLMPLIAHAQAMIVRNTVTSHPALAT